VPFYVTFRYRYLPEEDSYGLGPDTSLGDRSSYLQEETRVYLRTGYQFTPNFVCIVNAGYQANEIRGGKSSRFPSTEELFDETAAPGLTRVPDYARFGTQLFVDFRDEPGNPHRGFMVAAAYERFEDRTEDAFSFDRVGLDARGYVPLGSPQRILALRSALLAHTDRGARSSTSTPSIRKSAASKPISSSHKNGSPPGSSSTTRPPRRRPFRRRERPKRQT